MSWPTVALREVADIERNSVKPENIASGTRYLGLEHVESGGRIISSETVANGELASSKFSFGPRHILYGKLRPYLAKIALPEFNGVCSTDILPVLPSERIERNYLAHFLRQSSMVDYANSLSTGANLPRLSPKALAEFPIPLPPLEEQKRIAGILDQADALRRLRTRALEKLNTLGQAIFHEMFGDKIEPKSVQKLLEDKVLLVHKDGNHGSNYPRKEEFGPSGVPFLSAKVIDENGQLIASAVEYLNEAKAKTLKIGWIEAGDVLLSHNASVGKVVSYRGEYGPALIGTSLTCYRPNPSMLRSDFLEFALKSFDFQAQLSSNMSQTTRNQVPITAQKRLALTIPSMGDQIKFENRVASILTATSSQKKAANAQGALFASLQHRAFRGEL